MLEGILIEGFIYGIVALGVFMSFRLLNFADLTVDGSFPLGSAIMVVTLLRGFPTPLCMLMAFAGGCLAGLVTALIHTKLKVPDLLSGILTMTMLYSINLRIMGNRANISLLRFTTFFDRVKDATASLGGMWGVVIFCSLIAIFIKLAMDVFFRTDFGLAMGGLGANPQLVVSQGMDPDVIKLTGICISNGMISLAGGLTALYQGFADVGLGTGMIVLGLASVMLGELLIRSNRIFFQTLRVLLGAILYRALMYLVRNYGYHINMTPNDFKLITGLLIIVCIILSKNKIFAPKKRRLPVSGTGASDPGIPGVKNTGGAQ
ncbi:MAG: ABC transporter permease [Treponema sp.]|nr:ABC transporter permease [Treponema sp.]